MAIECLSYRLLFVCIRTDSLLTPFMVSGDFSRGLDKTRDVFALNIIMSDTSVDGG